MKRALGVAALGGGLLALSAGAASAQEVSADVSANLGRPTSAEVRVCADGRVLSGLLGSCGGSGTGASVQAGGDAGPTGVRSRPGCPARPRPTSRSGPGAAGRLPRGRLDLPAPVHQGGRRRLGDLTGEAPAGIGVLDTGPIASGNQVGVDVGSVSPSVPVTVCGNSVGALGDASASCGTSSSGGIIAPPPGTTDPTPGRTDTTGTDGIPGTTGTSGIPGTVGLAPGSGGSDGSATSLSPLRPSVAGSGGLPFTGAAVGLLTAGALVVRATRPAAATGGGGDR